MVRVEKKGAGGELVSGVHEKAFPFHFCQFDVQNRQSIGGGGPCPSYATIYGTVIIISRTLLCIQFESIDLSLQFPTIPNEP